MSVYLDENRLTKGLEIAFDDLQKQGALQGIDKHTFVQELVDEVKEGKLNVPELKMSDAKNFHNSLRSMLLDKEFAKLLFKNIDDMSPEERKDFQKDLEKIFKKHLDKVNKLSPNPLEQSKVDQLAKDLADGFVNKREDALVKDPTAVNFAAALTMMAAQKEKKEEDEKIMSPEERALRALNAGKNPGETDSMAVPVYEIQGNIQGFVNQTQGLAGAMGFMEETNRYDSDRTDDLGMEFCTLTEELASGAVVDTPLEEQLTNEGVTPSNTPRLEPKR